MSQFYHTPAPDSRVYRIRTLRRNMKPIFVYFRGCSKGCSSSNRIKSIVLSNEKYKGDALLQKVYTTDFLTKKKKKKEGEVPQYYVEGNHEASIPPAQFDRVQKEMQRRCGDTDRHGCVSIFSSKIRCGDCGGFYGSKVWHSNDKYRKVIWRCNHKYDDGKNCSTPHLDEETIKALYLKALRILGKERDEIVATFEAVKDEMYDTMELETEQAALQQEVMVVTELVEQCISENAHVAQNQKDYQKKYDALSDRCDRTKERLDKVSGRIMERQAKREMIEAFLHDIVIFDMPTAQELEKLAVDIRNNREKYGLSA